MSRWVPVAQAGEIPPGEGRAYVADGRMIAVFFVDGEYYAIDDACPHMGASLAPGWVEDGAVMCPWHAWRFCVRDGTWLDNRQSQIKIGAYDVEVRDGELFVALPDDPQRP